VSSPIEQVYSQRVRGFKDSSENAKELRRVESLAKVIQTLFRDIYNTAKFPKEEIYGLTSQMRRSVVSIPSNTCPVK